MSARVRLPRLVRAHLLALVTFGAMAASAHAARFTLAGSADTVSVAPGGTVTLDLVLRTASPAFNAFDLDVRFDPSRLTNSPISPLNSQRGVLMTSACPTNSPFHVFTPSADSLVCTLVIMCSGISVTGPGTLYRVRFIAGAADAWTTVSFGSGTTFYMGGPQVDTLETKPILIRIGSPGVLDVGSPRPPAAPALDPVVPNPGRGSRVLGASFRLPHADSAELSLLDPQGRRVAGLPRTTYAAGAQRAALDLPRLAPGRYTLVLRTGAGETSSRPWVVLR